MSMNKAASKGSCVETRDRRVKKMEVGTVDAMLGPTQ